MALCTTENNKVVAELRRDAVYVRNAMVAVVFASFGVVAIGATLADLLALAN